MIQAEGTQPIKNQWLKDDEEPLSDGEDYKGTTTAELVIVGTGPHVKGNYKCLVKHKYGEILSREISYGKFKLLTFFCSRSIASCTTLNFQIHLRLNYLLKD